MTRIDFLILADHASAKGGSLNLLGGGWTDNYRTIEQGKPIPISHFGVGVGIVVAPQDADRPHHLTLLFEVDKEGAQPFMKAAGDIKPKPDMAPPDYEQLIILAFNADFQWTASGPYRIVARLNDDPGTDRVVRFRVHDKQEQTQVTPTVPSPSVPRRRRVRVRRSGTSG